MRAGKQLCRRLAFALTLALACACVTAPAVAGTPTDSRAAAKRLSLRAAAGGVSGEYVPGEAIVRYERGVSAAGRREARSDAGVELEDALSLPRAETVEVDGSVAAAVRRLEQQSGVAYAQPNYRYEALAVEPPDDTFAGPEFEQFLWGLSGPAIPNPGVSVLEAWEDREGVAEVKGAGQVIAILDTGVDLTHPDLEANLWTNAAEGSGTAGVDDGDNGFDDDVHGYDFVDDDGNPDDYQFHGTHVAGTAAAIAGNEKGIAGVAPEAEIMAVRVLDGDGGGTTKEIAEGIVYAAENGADVINMSLGGPGSGDPTTSNAVNLAAGKDVVVVAAAGNEAADNDVEPHSPCVLPQANLICVAALNQSGALAGFSNYGVKSVDVAAPGTSILSAKTDYGLPLFEDGFESGFGSLWETVAFDGGIEWGLSPLAATGAQAASDSEPGDYGAGPENPAERAASALFTSLPVMDLSGERGCRLHFQTMYEIEPQASGGGFFDAFVAGATGEGIGAPEAVRLFAGESPSYPSGFELEEVSISDLDGRNDVHPLFEVISDEADQRDGAYVDDVRLICRDDETYEDAEVPQGAPYDLPSVGNYVRFNGTSMATPHVAGVVALVQAAAPGLSATEVVNAVLAGASAIPKPSTTRHTATEGIADACQAIAVATGADFEAECPESSENVPFKPPESPPPTPPVPPSPQPPPVVDSEPPRTFIGQRPPKLVRIATNRVRAVFRFSSNEAGATFLCSVDNGPYRACAQRLVRRFRVGPHVLRVVARDPAGNVDQSPAAYRFKVERRR